MIDRWRYIIVVAEARQPVKGPVNTSSSPVLPKKRCNESQLTSKKPKQFEGDKPELDAIQSREASG